MFTINDGQLFDPCFQRSSPIPHRERALEILFQWSGSALGVVVVRGGMIDDVS